MYCGHCGSLLPQGALFCGTCGKSVGAAAPSRVAFSTPERKSRRVWWLPSLPAALALIVLVYWCWNRLTTDNPPRPEVENTTTTSPAPRPPTRAEQYAMTLQQTYRNNGYDVSVLAFTNEKTLKLISDSFQDAESREDQANQLWALRKELPEWTSGLSKSATAKVCYQRM